MDKFQLIFTIGINLLFAVCVIFFGWTVYELVLFYWFESVFIGIVNLLKIFIVALIGDPFGPRIGFENRLSAVFTSMFLFLVFLMKFGAFVIGAGFLVVLLPSFLESFLESNLSDAPKVDALRVFMQALESVVYFTPLLAITHLYSFITRFLYKSEYLKVSIFPLLIAPYLRVFVLYITILLSLAAASLISSGAPTIVFSILIIAVKCISDIAFLRKEAVL